jgi:hypothetical protein
LTTSKDDFNGLSPYASHPQYSVPQMQGAVAWVLRTTRSLVGQYGSIHQISYHTKESIMKAKHTVSAAVLGTLMLTGVPAISHAESQAEWFLKQQQMTDGHTTILDDPSYRAYLRWNGFSDLRPATPSRANSEAQTKAANTQKSAEDKSGTKNSE